MKKQYSQTRCGGASAEMCVKEIVMHSCIGECVVCETWVDVYMERKRIRKARKILEICAQVRLDTRQVLGIEKGD